MYLSESFGSEFYLILENIPNIESTAITLPNIDSEGVLLKITITDAFGNINEDLPLILIILLCSNCILYSFVSFSYFKLHSLGLKPHPHVLGSGILCIFIVASIGIFLGVGEGNKIPGSLVSSTWVSLSIFTTNISMLC